MKNKNSAVISLADAYKILLFNIIVAEWVVIQAKHTFGCFVLQLFRIKIYLLIAHKYCY